MKDNSTRKRMSAVDVDQHILDIYEFKRRIGKGAYGVVWKAVERKTKEVVAVKKIFDAFKNKTDAQRTYREITFLQAFSHHPNIIKLKALHKANNNIDIYLVFEYMDTDLHNAIAQRSVLEDVHKRFVMYQLLKATRFIHSAQVVHRDQKPSNILVDRRCRCKVADFGLARSLARGEGSGEGQAPSPVPATTPAAHAAVIEQPDLPLTDYVATRWYRPPEVLLSAKRYTQGVDMWSLGCILAEMLLGRALFPGSSTVDQMQRILSALPPPSRQDVDAVCGGGGGGAEAGLMLLQRAAAAAAAAAGSAAGASLGALLRGQPPDAVDLVQRLLVLNPQRRLSAAQALRHPYVSKFRDHSLGYTISRRVIPELSDDFQWSVDEYRNRLYNGLQRNVSPQRGEAPARAEAWRSASHSKQRLAPPPPPAEAKAKVKVDEGEGEGRGGRKTWARRHVQTAPERRPSIPAAIVAPVLASVSAANATIRAAEPSAPEQHPHHPHQRHHHHHHHQSQTRLAKSVGAPPAAVGGGAERVGAKGAGGAGIAGGCTRCRKVAVAAAASASAPALAPAPLLAPTHGRSNTIPAPAHPVAPVGPATRVESKLSLRLQKKQEGLKRVAEWINNKNKFKPQASSTPNCTPDVGRSIPSRNDSSNGLFRTTHDIYTSTLMELRQAIKRDWR